MPVGYGIQKLQISCIVEDDKVGTEFLEEEICQFDDLVSHKNILIFCDASMAVFRFKV